VLRGAVSGKTDLIVRSSLLLTDVVMPNMRGPEMAKKLKGLLPELRIIYMSGYLEHNAKQETRRCLLSAKAIFTEQPGGQDP
jgi:CheY-like chemotaxis protein